jgi:molybdopterin converting factor small subunit
MCEAPFVRGFQPMEVNFAVIFIMNASNQGKGPLRFEVPANQTVLAALNSLALLTNNEYQTKKPLVAVVNGTTAEMTYMLQPGDIVQCFPQISGG